MLGSGTAWARRASTCCTKTRGQGIGFDGVGIKVNGRALEPEEVALETAPLEIRAARKRKPSALGYLMRASEPLPEERRGLAISTRGKVIKHGWDWLGVTPAAPERIGGLVEGPALAAGLTLNKAGFVRVGDRESVV